MRLRIYAGLAAVYALTALTGCMTTSSEKPVAAVNRPTDHLLSCEQITAETNEMNERLGIAEGDMRSAQAMGYAQDIAINAAGYSGALGSAAGSVPFLGQAFGVLGQVGRMNQESAKAEAEQAANRRNVLTGMYAAKGCASQAQVSQAEPATAAN